MTNNHSVAGDMKYGEIYKYKKKYLNIERTEYITNKEWYYIKCMDKRDCYINSYWVGIYVIKGGPMEGAKVGDIIGEDVTVHHSSYAEILAMEL